MVQQALRVLREVITAKIQDVAVAGGLTNVEHRLNALPNRVIVLSASVDIANIAIGAPTADHIPITNTDNADQTIKLLVERFHSEEGDVGMTVKDYVAATDPTYSDGIDNFLASYKENQVTVYNP